MTSQSSEDSPSIPIRPDDGSDDGSDTDADDRIPVCPECDSCDFATVVGAGRNTPRDQVPDYEYRCRECYTGFDEPAHRERKKPDHPHGIERTLLEADPDDLITDGGSAYVNPTGDGYAGIASVRFNSATLTVATKPVDWHLGDQILACEVPDGVALVADQEAAPGESLSTHTVSQPKGAGGAVISIAREIVDALGLEDGDDIRVYERDPDGLLLVDAADDPRLAD